MDTLLPAQSQAITWTNADLHSIRSLEIQFKHILIKIEKFSFTEENTLKHSAKNLVLSPGPIFYLWLSKVSDNEKRHYIM